MTPSHITRKKIKPWYPHMWGCHGFIFFLVICECWYFTLPLTEAWMHRCTKWNIKPVPILIEVTVLSQESNRSPICVLQVPISHFIRFDVLCWNCSDSLHAKDLYKFDLSINLSKTAYISTIYWLLSSSIVSKNQSGVLF
jgi:hypothetical protein